MEAKILKPYFVIIGLLAVTSLALALTVDVTAVDEAGVKMHLPDRVGPWQGQDLLFCHNRMCQKEYRSGDLKDKTVCPNCGGSLGTMSWAEKDMLPPDTEIIKKMYVDPSGRSLHVAIVLSGKERASIHRPEVCLVGQGSEVVASPVFSIPMQDRPPLEVTSLEMLRRMSTPDGQIIKYPMFYIYWFVGKNRETPSHVKRMIWMASDRIFHNVSHRWAYISVGGVRQEGSDAYREMVSGFLKDLYPQILIN